MKKSDNKSQIDRFKETARELGVDESEDALDNIFGKLDLKKPENSESIDGEDDGAE